MNNKLAVIIGLGANNLAIPLLVMESMQVAETLLRELGCESGTGMYSGRERWVVPYDAEDNESHPMWDVLLLPEPRYFGCGGCWALEVREIELGKPIVGWDLD